MIKNNILILYHWQKSHLFVILKIGHIQSLSIFINIKIEQTKERIVFCLFALKNDTGKERGNH